MKTTLATKFLSVAPGFSPVWPVVGAENRFNGFACAGKPLKQLTAPPQFNTRLKPGANDNLWSAAKAR